MFSAGIQGSVLTNHSHVFGEGWKECTFPVTHRFPLLLLFQVLRTNELGNLCLSWAPVLLCLHCSLGETVTPYYSQQQTQLNLNELLKQEKSYLYT